MPRTTTHRILIRRNLVSRLFERRGGGSDPSNKDFEREAGLPRGLLSVLGALEPRQTPSLEQLGGLGRAFLIPPWSLLDRETDPWLLRHRNVCWRLEGDTVGVREQALRVAAAGAVLGCAPGEIGERITLLRRSRDPHARAPTLDEIRHMARSGLALGAVTLVPSPRGDEIEAADLAAQLTVGLRAVAPRGTLPTARVVQGLAHPDFGWDPAAPLLVAHVARGWIAQALASRSGGPGAVTLGLAGGAHVEAFVQGVGVASSPLPDGDRAAVRLLPLPHSPRGERGPRSAEALVDELRWRLDALGGADGAGASSAELTDELDAVVFGCDEEGWSGRALGDPKRALALGTKLALLLTSGEATGVPLAVAVRAGRANAVICDQAAARAALAELANGAQSSASG